MIVIEDVMILNNNLVALVSLLEMFMWSIQRQKLFRFSAAIIVLRI
jgi:hypothetical protein